MAEKRFYKLYERLPEIYRVKDEDLPNNFLRDGMPIEALQLKSFLAPIEEMFGAIHENIESLYDDFFIETADDWVIPYLADLLGTSHLAGEAWTRRADVADTIALRRRKGTLGAIELLTFILTKWGVHSIELRERLVWNQHLNHQRPDAGGEPPYASPHVKLSAPIRGGTVNLRDPSLLSLLETPFDEFARVADVKPPLQRVGQIRYNLPNLAIFLWRLKDFRLRVTKPLTRRMPKLEDEPFVVRVNVNPIPTNSFAAPYVKLANRPLGQPVELFNTNRLDLFNRKRTAADQLDLASLTPRVSNLDQVPAPIPVERISDYEIAAEYDAALDQPNSPPFEFFAEQSHTAPHEYIAVETYDRNQTNLRTLDVSDVGFQLHLPEPAFPADRVWLHRRLPRAWTLRGENLCAWEKNLQPPLAANEIAVDPVRGRVVIGADSAARANALARDLLVTYTYAAVGDIGAHPISYPALPKELDKLQTPAVHFFAVNFRVDPNGLRDALRGISLRDAPTVIEIVDSFTHELDLKDSALKDDVEIEEGIVSLKLNAPLVIRAADNQRPIIALARPLAFRPANVVGADAIEQAELDARMNDLFVRLEGLFIARKGKPLIRPRVTEKNGELLIARAAINKLEILNCTLDPGGFIKYDGSRAPLLPSIRLSEPYNFARTDEENRFKQTPELVVQRSICGAIFTDAGYRLCLSDSIVDAGQGVKNSTEQFALSGASGIYAAQTTIRNATVLGRTRVASIEGAGAIFVGALEAENQQIGCLKFCYFADDAKNRLPANHACVSGRDARLIFTSEFFGAAAYCQLSLQCDRRILEEGVGNDQMGAFNSLLEAHKWRNLRIRFREFMPIGIRPLLIPVT